MNPAAHTTTAMGLSYAITVAVNALLVRCHVPPLSQDESLAYLTILGSAIGYYMHLRTVDPTFRLFRWRKPAAPPAPAAH